MKPTAENGSRTLAALRQFGLPIMDLKAVDFEPSDMILQFGVKPVRIDVITGVPDFAIAWQDRSAGLFAGLPTNYLGRATLIRNKLATGRSQDLTDVESLQQDDEEAGG